MTDPLRSVTTLPNCTRQQAVILNLAPNLLLALQFFLRLVVVQ